MRLTSFVLRRSVRRIKNNDIPTKKVQVPRDLSGNRLIEDATNPFDVTQRCKLCGTGISYKNAQLISQFVSPFTGRLYTENATGLCSFKYKELKRAYDVANKLLIIGPSKEPIYMNDPIGPENLRRIPSHGDEDKISRSLGLPDISNIQMFQSLLQEEDPNALEGTDVSKEELLAAGNNRWLSGEQIKFLFAETDDFIDHESSIAWDGAVTNFEEHKERATNESTDNIFTDDWAQSINEEIIQLGMEDESLDSEDASEKINFNTDPPPKDDH